MKGPAGASVFCIVGGAVVVLLASMIPFNSFLFLPSMISGIIVLIDGVMLHEKPTSHSLWSSLVIVVAVADLLGYTSYILQLLRHSSQHWWHLWVLYWPSLGE